MNGFSGTCRYSHAYGLGFSFRLLRVHFVNAMCAVSVASSQAKSTFLEELHWGLGV